jgi:hypothetical protein
MSEFPSNFERFKLKGGSTHTNRQKKSVVKPMSWFLKGPIPGNWLDIASGLPGRSLHVGMVVWFKHGLTKKDQFHITRKDREKFNIPPDAFRRGINHLKNSGLIQVERRTGRPTLITILKN